MATGRATRVRRSSTRPTGCTCKTGTTIAVPPDGAKAGTRPAARRHRGDEEGQAHRADRRPAQRREPDRRADPPRDDPLPQPGARQAARVGARHAAVHAGAQEGQPPLPVADPPRLPAADLRARPSSTTSSPTAASWSSPARPPDSVPAMPVEFSVAAFRLGHSMVRRDVQLEPDLLGIRRGAGVHVPVLRPGRRPRRRDPPDHQLGRRLPAHLRLRGRRAPGAQAREQRQQGQAHRHADHRSAREPAAARVRRRELDPVRRPAAQPRVPQPDPGRDGEAGERPADGREAQRSRRQRDAADAGRRSSGAAAARCSTS